MTSSIYGKKEVAPFQDLCSLCEIEETKLQAKTDVGSGDQNQVYVAMTRRRVKYGKFDPQKKKMNMAKIQCYGFQEYGHYKRDCPKLKKDNKKRGREEAHINEEVEEVE